LGKAHVAGMALPNRPGGCSPRAEISARNLNLADDVWDVHLVQRVIKRDTIAKLNEVLVKWLPDGNSCEVSLLSKVIWQANRPADKCASEDRPRVNR
jgi:hypothetical protein